MISFSHVKSALRWSQLRLPITFWPWLLVILCLSFLSPDALEAASRYRLQNICPEDAGSARAIDINDRGQVLMDTNYIYVYTPGQGYELVIWGGADSLNNAGQVVGQAGGYGAYLWSPGQPPIALPGIDGGVSEIGHDINKLGQVVGIARNAAGSVRNVRWDGPTSVTDLTTLPGWLSLGGIGGGELIRINDNGWMIGSMVFDDVGPWLGAIFAGDHWTLLGDLSGGTLCSWPMAINNRGEVVGSVATEPGGGQRHPFHWFNGAIRDLGLLPPYPEGEACAINEAGQIVGRCYQTDDYGFITDSRAVIWTSEGVVDLNSLVINLPPGEQLWSAKAINNSGQIIGQGYQSNFLFLLSPIHPTVSPVIDLLLSD